MQVHPTKFGRFFSEPGDYSQSNLSQENDNTTSTSRQTVHLRPPIKHDQLPKKNFLSQLSWEAEQKIDKLENDANRVSDALQDSRFTRVTSICEDETNHNDIVISSIKPHTIVETGITSHRDMKSGSQWFRWNLLFNLLLWLIVPFPLWIPFVSNRVAYYMIPSIQSVFVAMWTIIAILASRNAFIVYINRYRDFTQAYANFDATAIRHIVAISCYQEPVELIARSIQTVANQTEVHRITMVISFEDKTPNKDDKCRLLKKEFENSGFQRIIFTIHPSKVLNEIPGKCSNSNYGLRMAIQQMAIDVNETDNILVTTCDADSKFPPQYIAALTYKYLKENRPALNTIYQAPLFYNWKLDGLSFITRVTGLLRSFLMLGALIPFNINTMSIFSYSVSLAIKGNYIHPAYQMDDIICLIRWMGLTQQRLRISMIHVPVLSGPTSGETIELEIMEWARQARRWTIGAAEVFHYFTIKAKRMPAAAACSWGISFIIYYGILLCTGGLYGLTSMLSMFLIVKGVPSVISYIMYGMLGVQMLTFLIAFIIDMIIPKVLEVEEYIFVVRNFFHFLTTPFVLLGYSLVELYALHEVAIYGKKVCGHAPSKKTALN
ncbi:unnamed protein product [Adineta steineri]|uniref:Glycosyltransferase 2-like domain-containing protein n=1 Tax=Adineta steineri TaxID=433720 RepID=A0A814MUJ7_9BILA|nr:unnamed protein product [Adineta steineri]CAF1174515.1 unnamed protein product [Adineta steineri]